MASDNRIFYVLLVFFTILFQFIESTDVKVSLNWNESRKQPPHCLYLSIDPDLVVDNKTKGFKEGFDAINAMSMAAELSPAFLIMGGPSSDRSCFHFEPSAFSEFSEPKEENNKKACCYQRPHRMVITGEQLLLLSSFAEEAGLKIILTLGYDYNLHNKMLQSDTKEADDCLAWDENEANKLLNFANMMNISLNYQLGYELRYDYKCKKDENCGEERKKLQEEAEKSGAAYGSDVNQLRRLLDKYPASKKSLIIPSGIRIYGNAVTNVESSSENSDALSDLLHSAYAQAYLDECSKNLDAVIWHTSTFKDEKGQNSTGYNSTIFFHEMNNAQQIFGQSALDKPLWIGETYRDEFSTLPASANEAFNVALNWIQHIGTVSKKGDSAIFHSLKKVGEDSPDPKYWVSLLHKNLAGSVVAQTNVMGINNTEKNLFFAHCTPYSEKYRKPYIESFPRGSVTVYAANPSNKPRNVLLQVGQLKRNDESMDNEIYEYVLTPEKNNGKYTGKAKLNGVVMEMGVNGVIPHIYPNLRTPWKLRKTRSAITRISRKYGRQFGKAKLSERMRKRHRSERYAEANNDVELFMPPMSIVFWVIPRDVIGETPCMEEEEDTEKKIQQFLSFSHRSSSTEEKDPEDPKKQTDDEIKSRKKRQIQRASLAEISKRRVQARKIRPFANMRKKTSIKTLDKEKREIELESTDHDFNLRKKRKSRHYGRVKVPKTVSFDIDDGIDEPEAVEDGYEKGMLTLSEVIALSSKESGTFDDDYSDDVGERKIKPGVLKGIWNLGKKLSDKVPPRGIYNGPSTHIMGLGRKPKPIAVINEPKRELFEADVRGWEDDEDESKIDLKEAENGESNEDDDFEQSDDYEDIDKVEIVGQDPKSSKDKTKVNGLKIVSNGLLEPEEMDADDESYLSDEYDECAEDEDQNLHPSSKKDNGRIMKASKAEEKQYFRRYKRETGENLVAKIENGAFGTNEAFADTEKNGSRRDTRRAALAADDSDVKKKILRFKRVIKVKDFEDDVGNRKSSPVIKDASGSTKESLNNMSVNHPSNGFLERETNWMDDVFSNDISGSSESEGEMPKFDEKLYSLKSNTLNDDGNDGNDEAIKREKTYNVNRSQRQIRRESKLVPIDKKRNDKVPKVTGRILANKDVISRQLSSPQIEEGNLTDTSPDHPRKPPGPNVHPHPDGRHGTSFRMAEIMNSTSTTESPALSILSRRSDASRADQKRISMEAFRRRTIEERRKAMREYKEMLEQRRQRRVNPGKEQVIGVFNEGMQRFFRGFKAGRRPVREIDQVRPKDGEREKTEPDKVRERRQSRYDDSVGADHHRVIRKTREITDRRKEKPARVTPGSRQEIGTKNLSLDEIWPVDKEFGNIAEDRYDSEKLSTYSPEKWRDALRNEPKKSNDYSIDTDKAYKPGLYDVINNMLESVPLSKIDLESIDANKSRYLSGKDERVLNSTGKWGKELDEEKQDEIFKRRSFLTKDSRSDYLRKSLRERIQKAKEERRKALEKKSRDTRSVNYDFNRILDDDSLLTNKIAKHKKTMSDKAKQLFYVLNENKLEQKNGNALETHLQDVFGVDERTSDTKVDIRNISDKRNTVDIIKVIPEKDKMKQLTNQLASKEKETKKKIEVIKAGLRDTNAKNSFIVQKETSVYKSDDSFFSHILQQLFKFMDSLHSVMSSPIR